MTSRERLLTVISGGIPDHVPVAPDTSNMIPAKLTGKPYWDLYLYNDPPIWKAYIDCVKYFGFDSLMDGYAEIRFKELGELESAWDDEVIVYKNRDRIVTQKYKIENGNTVWNNLVDVYFVDNPPSKNIKCESIGLPVVPKNPQPIEGRKSYPEGEELLSLVKDEMGDHGLVGVVSGISKLVSTEDEIYDYYDNPEKYDIIAKNALELYKNKLNKLLSLETKPDFICTGASGTLIHQTLETFRRLGLPIVKEITRICRENNMPTHVHSCGPEKELVKIFHDETDLTIIDPLEIPPMGDCDLKELKRLYGKKLILKGNLHTTNVMLNGSADDVVKACKKAIDDAAEGGRFILSTGDQCGPGTPEENIFAMIETAKTYGKY